jgi:hypothetical protein
VSLSLGVVLILVKLVTKGVLGSRGTGIMLACIANRQARVNVPGAEGSVRVLSNVLVGLLGGSAGSLLDRLGDVVDTLLERIHCEVFGSLCVMENCCSKCLVKFDL